MVPPRRRLLALSWLAAIAAVTAFPSAAEPERSPGQAPAPSTIKERVEVDLLELKVHGRNRAIEMVGEILPHFLAGNGQAMIVASGRDRVTVEPLTSDLERLRATLARLATDPAGVDTGPAFEDQRADQLRTALEKLRSEWAWDLPTQLAEKKYLREQAEAARRARAASRRGSFVTERVRAAYGSDPSMIEEDVMNLSAFANMRAAVLLLTEAHRLQREEMARAQVSLDRLVAALAQFTTVDRTKVVLYFAELGGTLISGGSLREQFSPRLDTSSVSAALAVEVEVRLPPGPFVLVGLARETSTDTISSLRVEGLLPDPQDEPGVSFGPLAVLQPARGGFVRGSKSKHKGFLVLGPEMPLRGDLPTAIVGLVCVAPEHRSGLRVERRLVGESEVPLTGLPPLDFGKGRCIQLRDVIPERTLGMGWFLYTLQVLSRDGGILGSAETRFVVGGSAERVRERAPG